jgi:hypothetical protein
MSCPQQGLCGCCRNRSQLLFAGHSLEHFARQDHGLQPAEPYIGSGPVLKFNNAMHPANLPM